MSTKTAEIAVPNSIEPGPAKPNLLAAALANDDGDAAVTAIRGALGIESDDVANYSLPKHGRMTASSVRAVLPTGSPMSCAFSWICNDWAR